MVARAHRERPPRSGRTAPRIARAVLRRTGRLRAGAVDGGPGRGRVLQGLRRGAMTVCLYVVASASASRRAAARPVRELRGGLGCCRPCSGRRSGDTSPICSAGDGCSSASWSSSPARPCSSSRRCARIDPCDGTGPRPGRAWPGRSSARSPSRPGAARLAPRRRRQGGRGRAGALVALALRRRCPAGSLAARRGLPAVVATRGLLSSFFCARAYIVYVLRDRWGLTPAPPGSP